MADYSVVAADVEADALVESNQVTGTSGEAITAGQPVRVSSADNKIYQGQADTLDNSDVVGIALNSAPGDNQPITYATTGAIDLGVSVDDGDIAVLSATKGGIAPAADLVSGNFPAVLGVFADDKLLLSINKAGVAKA